MKSENRQPPTETEIITIMKFSICFGLNYTYDQASNFIIMNLRGGSVDDKQSEETELEPKE